jgi:hypothetical protein
MIPQQTSISATGNNKLNPEIILEKRIGLPQAISPNKSASTNYGALFDNRWLKSLNSRLVG